METRPQRYAPVIEKCEACADAADACIHACMHDVQDLSRCLSLCIDCAQMNRLLAGALSRNSEHAQELCALCADICQTCANECARHQAEVMARCAHACDVCAQACHRAAMATPRLGRKNTDPTGGPYAA